MVDNARKIVLTVNIPVFSDADTGYGDAVIRTARSRSISSWHRRMSH